MAKTFEVGLVCAGAISGGAYQAGVLDFLLQALEEWYKAKDDPSIDQNLVPPHEVSIKVITGASAGGMSAAIFTSMTGDNPCHISDWLYPVPSGNRLYDAWVGIIDIAQLCGIDDLDSDKLAPVTSLLNSSIIDVIASAAISKPYGPRRPRYFSDPLQVGLSIANMGGVPYVIKMVTSTNPPGTNGLNIRIHADYREFYLTTSGKNGSGVILEPNIANGWEVLKETAKATGAFPIGLAPRITSRDVSDYSSRNWCIPKAACTQSGDKCFDAVPIEPVWLETPTSYSFLTMDGGTMNNAPTELAREKLMGGACMRLERRGDLADKGLLLIVPFPGFDPPVSTNFQLEPHKANLSLLNLAASLMGAWLEQARFKTEELVLAADEEVYSEFLIGPSDGATLLPKEDPRHIDISGATLFGFGAFLFRDFRDHDFQLGRRNCQRFLETSFALPEENPLFTEWPNQLRTTLAVADPTGPHLPIIPLFGTARAEVPRPFWPRKSTNDINKLRVVIGARIGAVAQRLADTLPSVPLKWLAKIVLQFGGAGKLTDVAMQKIQDSLREHDLMT
jgi:hypothetical protein